MKFALIKERKNPPDRRVVLSPEACKKVLTDFPKASVHIESSDIRVFKDEEYSQQGLDVVADVSDCDVLFGVKEVPIEALVPNKSYFFFSHTIKKQPYNRELLRAILDKNITFYDHETITNANGQRLVAFGRYAGIVGAYNGFRTFGLKNDLFKLPKAETLINQKDLIASLNKIKLPNIKIVLTGKGRVSNGAKEMLDAMDIKEVAPDDYVTNSFNEPVYTQLDVLDYNKRKDGEVIDMYDFFNNPAAYEGDFMRFAKVSDFYIACHYWDKNAPFIFSREDAKCDDFKIKVIADVSCDIDGPVASTLRASTIADPIYGYNPVGENEVDYKNENAIAVMAVDNLPCELPNDASVGFGENFLEYVIPAFFNGDKDGVLARAKMTENGKLTSIYSYLQDYVEGKE